MTIVCLTDPATDPVRRLVEQFGLTVATSPPEVGEYLLANSSNLNLCRAGERGRIKVDFSRGAAQYRRIKGGDEPIVKVINHTAWSTVWDAAGNLRRSSFMLVSLGPSVRAFKQNPVVAYLLSGGLARALQDDDIRDIAQRITLHFGGVRTLMSELASQAGRPGMVHLDPMYPERRKSAVAKKEVAYFRGLVDAPQNEVVLLATARTVARKRIVVKHPWLGIFLNGEKPAYQYTSKSARFDVYLPFNLITEK